MKTRWIRRSTTFALLVVAFIGSATAAEKTELPLNRLVGQRLTNLTLENAATGETSRLYSFHGKRAIVLAFFGTDCPVGDLYAPRLEALNQKYKDRGVQFLGVNSNAHESAQQVTAYAKEHGLSFPVLKDQENKIADTILVERTCEVVVLDGLAIVRYRGAIDDQYGVGTRKANPEHNYLGDALEELVTGGRVEPKATAVAGCLLDRIDPKPSKAAAAGNASRVRPAPREVVEVLKAKDGGDPKIGPVTFSGEVDTIVRNKCQNCHRPGEVGPFPLLTYDDARKHSAMIREVVDDRRMPPWHADPRYGHFSNDRSLTSHERATLLAWVDQGTPLGDASKVPPPQTFPVGWTIGTPDVEFEIPEPFTVPAQGTVEYVHIRVPTKFKEDVWVQAAEARPGDRSVVHHIIVYVDDHSLKNLRDARSLVHLCGYAPGDMPSVYPDGAAKKIPAGSDLLFQIHYTPTGKVRTDQSKVGLIFSKTPVEHLAHTEGIVQEKFEIPPGADSHPVKSTFTFPKDAHLLSLLPHMHLRGKDFRYDVTYPDGRKEVLLSVPAYDFGWQSYYILAEPKAMPKGTTIDCLAHFDNSTNNPSNPDPTKAVRWGSQTWQEMMIGFIDYTDDAPPGTTAEPRPSGVLGALRSLGRGSEKAQNAPATGGDNAKP